MIRRDPTRIELTLDDIQEYHLRVKQEAEAKRNASKVASASIVLDGSMAGDGTSINGTNIAATKTRTENVQERIGFNPTPRNS